MSAPAPAITSAIRSVVPGCNHDLIILRSICRVGGSIAIAIRGIAAITAITAIAAIAVTVASASAAAAGAGRLYDDGSGRIAAAAVPTAPTAGSSRRSADA